MHVLTGYYKKNLLFNEKGNSNKKNTNNNKKTINFIIIMRKYVPGNV